MHVCVCATCKKAATHLKRTTNLLLPHFVKGELVNLVVVVEKEVKLVRVHRITFHVGLAHHRLHATVPHLYILDIEKGQEGFSSRGVGVLWVLWFVKAQKKVEKKRGAMKKRKKKQQAEAKKPSLSQ
jgi:DNA integrity scanning protein DisA with diadenylate cyclase activity